MVGCFDEPPPEDDMSTLPREIVLVVDDVPANTRVPSEILGTEYRLTFATNGADATFDSPAAALLRIDCTSSSVSVECRPKYLPSLLAMAMPSRWRCAG